MVALSPDGQRAYVANIGSGSLTAIDLATGQLLKQIATGNGAEGLAVTVDGTEVWVSNREADTLSVVDTATLSVKTTIPAKGFPIRVAMARDGRQALVTCAKAGELAVFDVKTKRELQQIKLDQNEGFFSPQFGLDSFPVGVIADSHRIFVASTGARRIAIVDPKLWTVSGYWPVGEEPDGMAIAP
jgi:YVTN family beta-propeller protein